MNEKIYAGIVSYNPDLKRLDQNIKAILPQVDKVVIFDNGSENQEAVNHQFEDRATIIKSDSNIGIAAALNRLIQWGKDRDYLWMISLDQDSVCDAHYVEQMDKYLSITDSIGIVAPTIIDRNIGIVGHNPKDEWVEVRTCITSGSFNNIKAWVAIGGYDESMFIDSVDFEYCYRLRKNGFKVIQVGAISLLHELGESSKRRFLFWKVDVNGHSAFRKYYIARNNVYYPLKHRLWLHFIRGNIRNVWLMFLVALYEEEKKKKIRAIRNGWHDGIKARKINQ